MCDCVRGNFWLDNVNNLFYSSSIIPTKGMKLEEKMNSITRLILIIFIVLLACNFKYDISFLFFSIIIIIIIYYSKKRMVKENFTNENNVSPVYMNCENDIKKFCSPKSGDIPQNETQNSGKYEDCLIRKMFVNGANLSDKCNESLYDSSAYHNNDLTRLLCPDDIGIKGHINNNESLNIASNNYVSLNKSIVGNKSLQGTRIAPVIATPASSQVWRQGSLTSPSPINKESCFDLYNSGYYSKPDNKPCERFSQLCEDKYKSVNGLNSNNLVEYKIPEVGYTLENYNNKCYRDKKAKHSSSVKKEKYYPDEYISISNKKGGEGCGKCSRLNCSCDEKVELYPDEYLSIPLKKSYDLTHLPTNLYAGKCQQSPELSQYNDRLFTQNVGPDSFAKTTYIEPANANIGISEPLQQPTMYSDKNMTYILDPKIYEEQT